MNNDRARFALGAVLSCLLAVVIWPAFASPAAAAGRRLVLPIPPGEVWYVCQGYNGSITHEGIPGLDLSLERSSVGPDGCLAKNKYSSAGSIVTSPAAGFAQRWPGCCGDDFVCVNLASGGSVAIGHLSNRVASGTVVAAGERVGTVAWPHRMNGDYAHIHVQAHTERDCTEGSDPVAFDVAHGFKWACAPDLPYTGIPNEYSGLALERCDSGSKVAERRVDAQDPKPNGQDAKPKTSSWVVQEIVRCAWEVMAFAGGRR